MKAISILGSTGSIGCNTLKVVEHLGDTRVVAMAAGRNMKKFAEQIKNFSPQLVSCENDAGADELERELHGLGAKAPEIVLGMDGLTAVATHDEASTLVSATVGAVGFVPTLRAIEAGKRIALANKEYAIVQTAGSPLPELHLMRYKDKASPVWRQWNLSFRILLL
jgi:1-deoxy-D-xylulose-5-phosphate reductoisomerase